MFFISKALQLLVLPPGILIGASLVGLYLIHRQRIRGGTIVIAVTAGLFYMLSIAPTAFLLARSTERVYVHASADFAARDIEAIVILAGGADKSGEFRPFSELAGASWRRLWQGMETYRRLHGAVPIIYSGSSGDPADVNVDEAALAKEYALRMGISPKDFLTEGESRTTAESGVALIGFLNEHFPKAQPHRVALVTSLFHMPRSVEVMERAGIVVFPVIADIRSPRALPRGLFAMLPSVDYFSLSCLNLREWVGRAVYGGTALFDKALFAL